MLLFPRDVVHCSCGWGWGKDEIYTSCLGLHLAIMHILGEYQDHGERWLGLRGVAVMAETAMTGCLIVLFLFVVGQAKGEPPKPSKPPKPS